MSGEGGKHREPEMVEFEVEDAEMDEATRRRLGITEEAKQYQEMMAAASKHAPPALVPYIKKAAPVLGYVAAGINRVGPVMFDMYTAMFNAFQKLPHDLMMAVFGLALCFFGGIYPTAIAAAEAFRVCGWETTKRNLQVLWKEHQRFKAVNDVDNKRDDDGDGVADVDQIDGKELYTRKLSLFLAHADPAKLTAAGSGLWTATLGVVGVLKIKFARTATLGAAIGDVARKTLGRVLIPILAHTLPQRYKKWVPTLVNWLCKAIGISIAWTVQRILSAWHAAIRGGHMFAIHILRWYAKQNGKTFDDKESYLDEMVGYGAAALGLLFQLMTGFSVPFPFWLVLWPVSAVEYALEWAITD